MKLTCDRCGKILLLDEDVRYKVRVEIYAAYDPMELTADDLAKDHEAEMRRILRNLEKQDERTVAESVHKAMEFELCPACQRAFVRNPLGVEDGLSDE